MEDCLTMLAMVARKLEEKKKAREDATGRAIV